MLPLARSPDHRFLPQHHQLVRPYVFWAQLHERRHHHLCPHRYWPGQLQEQRLFPQARHCWRRFGEGWGTVHRAATLSAACSLIRCCMGAHAASLPRRLPTTCRTFAVLGQRARAKKPRRDRHHFAGQRQEPSRLEHQRCVDGASCKRVLNSGSRAACSQTRGTQLALRKLLQTKASQARMTNLRSFALPLSPLRAGGTNIRGHLQARTATIEQNLLGEQISKKRSGAGWQRTAAAAASLLAVPCNQREPLRCSTASCRRGARCIHTS